MKQKDIERCESFHSGTMSKEDSLAFEEELKSDSRLKEVYDLYKKSLEVIEMEGIREEIRGIHTKKSNDPANLKITGLLIKIGIAASLLMVATIGFWMVKGDDTLKKEVLLESKPFVDVVTMRNTENAQSSELMTLYNSGNYDQYLELYKNIENPTEIQVFYAGQSYLMTNEPEPFLESVDELEDSSFFIKMIPWYMVVAYSKMDVTDEEVYQELLKLKEGDYNYEYGQKLLKKFRDSFSTSKRQ